ncbi:alpha/beta hydrolase [Nitratireductor sp. XY-223]|uniref:alpha/beta fold hydrolase n=1 Tax=Nitratireductor sp. XY-223 TaxID=2561926 RepID=UPI0010AAA136|nr:alpha/beta hydrolase [Nitratireductor sp. XY-223]
MDDTVATRVEPGFDQVYFSASDGLKLAARDYGRGRDGTDKHATVVCLPGLTRNSADFHDLALILSRSEAAPRRVVCFDYRGRGLSEWDKDKSNYNIQVETDDVLAGCAALAVKHAAFVGTSRGALIIHALAAMRPGIMSAAILNDAGPVVEGAGLAQIMAYHDRIKDPSNLLQVAETLKTLQGAGFGALSNQDWRDLAAASFEEKDGKVVGRFDPALIDMLHAIDLNVPLPTLWPQFDGLRNISLLTIRGENSSLLSQATVDEMASRNPDMQRNTAPGQGHAPLLHVGDLPKVIAAFLRDADKS